MAGKTGVEEIKKLNRRDRRARRGRIGKMLKARMQGGKKVNTAPKGVHGTISALSASSSFILLSSIPEDRKGKRSSYS
jgi:hypothetical protein